MAKGKSDVRKIKLPPGMSKRAQVEFARVRGELVRLGYVEIDQPALVAYLTHHALCEDAKEKMAELGPIILTPKGQVQINPWHSILKQNSELMKKWVQELGFSPGSRKRLGIELKPVEDDDELFEE